jgi:hypothetical protein
VKENTQTKQKQTPHPQEKKKKTKIKKIKKKKHDNLQRNIFCALRRFISSLSSFGLSDIFLSPIIDIFLFQSLYFCRAIEFTARG